MVSNMSSPFLLLLLLQFLSLGTINCTTFTITNNCPNTIWPGLLSGAGTPPLSTTGFILPSGDSTSLNLPSSWSGRLWARTHCTTNPSNSTFSCATGDCATNNIQCSGAGAASSVTLIEFTLNGNAGLDFFDVSLVDGYNLPVLVSPSAVAGGAAAGNCTATGCLVDLNGICPNDLRVVLSGSGEQTVACRSACDALGSPEYCCTGEYGGPATCKPSAYSQLFKNACPRAYSYAYDDASSTFTCPNGVNYAITFCPSVSSQKAGENNPRAAAVPLVNDTMVFMGPDSSDVGVSTRKFSAVAAVISLAVFGLLL